MPTPVGLTPEGRLQPPPKTPNCVSSMADPGDTGYYIAPIAYSGIGRDEAREHLLAVLRAMPRTRQVEAQTHYLCFEFRTKLFKFTDDVEFLLPDDTTLIHVRSASRVGYSDMGTNRKRLEAVRAAFKARLEQRATS